MLQVGGGYSLADSDYSQRFFRGGSLYATYDFSPHLGVEFMLHQVNTPYDDKRFTNGLTNWARDTCSTTGGSSPL